MSINALTFNSLCKTQVSRIDHVVINHQNKLRGLDALSISPFLVIDDNTTLKDNLWEEIGLGILELHELLKICSGNVKQDHANKNNKRISKDISIQDAQTRHVIRYKQEEHMSNIHKYHGTYHGIYTQNAQK